ncbi:TonB-dependent receptor [Catenovulum sp. SM1970]|uniref:TonB-dependent receptor n=1 Tax=Marinifaba aquimaris TaxID=2741323 RepID=UPI0015741183|nr:TonB-dependent receptor [Marinifaba aquimaris]NTS76742.1 TonB-dependent receptor [Marinifaba aquimaris]
MSSIKLNKITQAMSLAAVMGTSVSAPVVMAAESAAEETEVIQVRGIRGSLKQALNTKRFSNAVVDSVSAEDIGKFPDKNIAESLQRIPGIAISRTFSGEGGEVSIRGTNPELTSTTLNGNYVASTGWFVQQELSRSFNMDLMPPEMVAGVDVYKSPTAKLDEGGVGGTVVLRTRKPLDLEQHQVFASAEMQMNSIADDDEGYGLTGLYSWKNEDETFGALIALSTLETVGRAHKAENYMDDAWAGAGIAEFKQDRERDSINIVAQYNPTEELAFTANYLDIELDAGNTNQNYLYIAGGNDLVDGATQFSPEFNNALNGTAQASPLDESNTRRAIMETSVFSFEAEYKADNYVIKSIIGKTEAEGGNGGRYQAGWQSAQPNQTIDIDFTGNNSMLLSPSVDASDHSDQRLTYGGILQNERTDEESFFQVDATVDVEWGPIVSVDTGFKVRSHEFSSQTFNWTFQEGTFDYAQNGGITKADFADGDFDHSGEGLMGDSPRNIARIDGFKYANYLDNQKVDKVLDESSWGKVEEDIMALYFQSNFEGDGYRGNLGMRYVETDVTGTSFDLDELNAGNRVVAKDENDYSDWLPSLNLAVDISDEMILRASAARVMSRPNYTFLLPSFDFDDLRQTYTQGSADIDPYRATQMDLGVEWYFSEDGLASATIFSKDIQSFIISGGQKTTQNIGGVDRDVFTPAQGLGGKIEGIELQYQQNFGNFGVIANFTYADGEGQRNVTGEVIDENGESHTTLEGVETAPLPGTSKYSYNLTGFYEDDLISARLAYTYRDDFLGQSTGIGGNVLWDGHGFLDGGVTWHVTEQIDLSFEATNLLGEVTVQRLDTAYDAMRLSADNGTNYYLKASFRM